MDKGLKSFDKYITAEDAIGSACLDGKCPCKTLNIGEPKKKHANVSSD